MTILANYEYELASFLREQYGMTLEPLGSDGARRRFRLSAPAGTPANPAEVIFYVKVENVEAPTEAELYELAAACKVAREQVWRQASARLAELSK